MIRTCLFFLCCAIATHSQAQIQAKAISYKVEVDQEQLYPTFEENEGNPRYLQFEIDAYYTDSKVKTIVRKIGKHPEPGLTIRQRQYDINSIDEYNIDPETEYILFKKNQVVKLKGTGKQKDILGYRCKEFTFTDYRGVQITVWVTEKLPKNICPMGNYSLKGTALEILTSNGLHYTASDVAEGVLESQFFDIPQGYQQEVVEVPSAEKKSR
jgi:GLPGLI family protein